MNMKRFLSIFFVLPLVFVSCDLTMDEINIINTEIII